MNHAQVCSCGNTKHHVILTREAACETKIAVWSDGTLTTGHALGLNVPGLGRPRSEWARKRRAKAVRLLAEHICFFSMEELPLAVKAYESTFKHNYRSEIERANHARFLADRSINRAKKESV